MKVRIGVAAIALAMCFVGLGTASAWAAHEYEAPLSTKAFGGGAGTTQEFTFGTLAVKCQTGGWEGKQPVPSTKAEDILKSYGSCTMLGVTPVTKVNHCVYDLLEPKGSGPFEAGLTIANLGSTCEVVFEDPSVCIVKFGAQTFEGPQLSEENNGVAAMFVNFKIKKVLLYSSSGTCTGIGTGKDGSYTGRENIEGIVVK